MPDGTDDGTKQRHTDQWYIAHARVEYGDEGRIEIDDDAKVSRGSDPGAYVQAWVWVYDDLDPDDEEDTDG